MEAVARTVDLVAFENEFDRPMFRLVSDRRFGHMCWVAWTCLHRQGIVDAEFGPWLETVDTVALVDSEASPVPLAPTASTSA